MCTKHCVTLCMNHMIYSVQCWWRCSVTGNIQSGGCTGWIWADGKADRRHSSHSFFPVSTGGQHIKHNLLPCTCMCVYCKTLKVFHVACIPYPLKLDMIEEQCVPHFILPIYLCRKICRVIPFSVHFGTLETPLIRKAVQCNLQFSRLRKSLTVV